jgi:hypothetical protein
MYVIDDFDTAALLTCRESLHSAAFGAKSMEEVATRIVHHLYAAFVTQEGDSACALARFYKTHRLASLPADLQDYVRRNGPVPDETSCLTLLGTAGMVPEWNDVRASTGHRAIPLSGDLSDVPMIAALIADLGVDRDLVLRPPEDVQTDLHLRQYNVFYVAEATGSDAVPAQEQFVLRYGIRSVVGFGGVLASGDTFAVILFTRSPVPEEVLPSFRTLSLTVKALAVPHTYHVFRSQEV